eukprot:2478892-Pyramimonas_sp.AAC.1
MDLVRTPSGHLAIKVDECDVATEADGARAFTIAANPRCERTPLRHVIKDIVDTEPIAGQPASSSAGLVAPVDAHALM